MRCQAHNFEYQVLVGSCPYCEADSRGNKAREQAEEAARQRADQYDLDRAALEQSARHHEERQAVEEARHYEREEIEDRSLARLGELEETKQRNLEEIEETKQRNLEEIEETRRRNLANKWRYEAESKLKQARALHAAGAHHEALGLANEAARLGMDVYQLRASIYKALGNTLGRSEQLQGQIGFLKISEDFADFTSQQERILREVLELGGETGPLFTSYFEAASTWRDFPYGIQAVAEDATLLGSTAYIRDFIAKRTLPLQQRASAARVRATPLVNALNSLSRTTAMKSFASDTYQQATTAYASGKARGFIEATTLFEKVVPAFDAVLSEMSQYCTSGRTYLPVRARSAQDAAKVARDDQLTRSASKFRSRITMSSGVLLTIFVLIGLYDNWTNYPGNRDSVNQAARVLSTVFTALGGAVLVAMGIFAASIAGKIAGKIWAGLAPGPRFSTKEFDDELAAISKLEVEIKAVQALGARTV